jgi:hypothetical protein
MATHETHTAINRETHVRVLEYVRDAHAQPVDVTLTPSEVADALDCPVTSAQSALYRLHTRLEWLSDAGGGQYRVAGSREA